MNKLLSQYMLYTVYLFGALCDKRITLKAKGTIYISDDIGDIL